MMEAVVQDVGYTLRQIRRSPAFAVGTVAVLSVAMAITVVCFVFVRAYLLWPLPVPAPDRLVWLIPGPSRESEVGPPDGFFTLDWTAADEQFETTVAWDLEPYRLVLQRGGNLAVIGVAAGALLSALVTRAVATQVPAVRALGVMPQIVLAAGLVLLTAVALLAPARRAARVNPASLLRD